HQPHQGGEIIAPARMFRPVPKGQASQFRTASGNEIREAGASWQSNSGSRSPGGNAPQGSANPFHAHQRSGASQGDDPGVSGYGRNQSRKPGAVTRDALAGT